MNEAVKRFLDEMGAGYAADGDRDTVPILFKADNENAGTVFELSLPKGEPHPYWRIREREMTADEVVGLVRDKTFAGLRPIGSMMSDRYRIRGYVFNARLRNEWNASVDGVA